MDKEKDRLWREKGEEGLKLEYLYNELSAVKHGFLILFGLLYIGFGIGFDFLVSSGYFAMQNIGQMIVAKITVTFLMASGLIVIFAGIVLVSNRINHRKKFWKMMGEE